MRAEKTNLIEKSREAMLSAVQIYNNPLIMFKSESYIVLAMIAWTYLLHAYYKDKGIDYRYFSGNGSRKRYVKNPDGSIKYWDLKECISNSNSPIDKNTKNNLVFLIGLRNQIEHKKADGLDSYMSARYQACALNYNYYLKLLFGEKKGLDNNLALSLQFAELSFNQVQIAKNNEKLIPKEIKGYIADFDDSLPQDELKSDRFAYRLLFTKVVAKRAGQADRVIEFIDPDSALAKSISKEYYVIKKEKSKLYLARQVLSALAKKGINLSIPEHTILWKKYDAKNSSKGFGTSVGNSWFWYNDWIEFLTKELAS
jgi:hypothetical protein